MARWAGWGAGPAGAGAAGGPSRLFLGGAMVLAGVLAVVFASQGRLPAAGVAGCAAIYFAFRLLGGLGRRP